MTAPERVVFNGRFLTQVHTGVQRYAAETLRALDGLLDESSELRSRFDAVLAVPAGARALALRRIRTVAVGRRKGHLWEQIDLPRFARRDFIVNFNYSGPWFGRRQLITIHDATVPAMPQAFSRGYRLVHNVSVAVLGRSARSVMTVSEFSRAELARWFGLTRDDIVVGCEGGEHAVRSVADQAAVLLRHGLESGRYVLGVGSVKPNKNFGLVARAMALLPGFAWPFAVAGAKDIGIFRDATALPDGLVFLGFVDDDDLSVLYRHAACFVFPSLYEGFGLPPVEAMAHDCPVLSARAASMPEVCGDAALYFDPEDPASLAQALRTIAEQPERRAALIAAGRKRLLIYNWRRNARVLVDHLQGVLFGHAVASASSAHAPMSNDH